MNDLHPDIIDLLVLRATDGLSEEQQTQLRALLDEHGLDDVSDFDLAAAAAANAFSLKQAKNYEEAPEGLKAKLAKDAAAFFDAAESNVIEMPPNRPPERSRNWGWAAAAMLALALVFTHYDDFDSQNELPGIDYAEARLGLIAAGSPVIPWTTPEDPRYSRVTGDVVWDNEQQQGYMLLTGMPANDPGESQYQLWLVDPDRDSNPVDGGVFDIPPDTSTVVVPIDAKLAVDNPRVFAITREQPGGVVVSKGPLLVVASAG